MATPETRMSGYATRELHLRFGGEPYRVRALSDRQQYADPHRLAERAGISSSQWSLFGQVWPSGRWLAERMCTHAVDGRRILELGCGLGLASLVLSRRRADITASDHHPLAGVFLAHNAALNGLPPIAYCDLPWAVPDAALGRFDLIIGSDVLYERGQAALLSALVLRHARPACELMISDPGRGNSNAFTREMLAQGYVLEETRGAMDDEDVAPFRGRVLSYRRRTPGTTTVA